MCSSCGTSSICSYKQPTEPNYCGFGWLTSAMNILSRVMNIGMRVLAKRVLCILRYFLSHDMRCVVCKLKSSNQIAECNEWCKPLCLRGGQNLFHSLLSALPGDLRLSQVLDVLKLRLPWLTPLETRNVTQNTWDPLSLFWNVWQQQTYCSRVSQWRLVSAMNIEHKPSRIFHPTFQHSPPTLKLGPHPTNENSLRYMISE